MGVIKVKTEASSLEQSNSQAITGVIFFDFDSCQFPEKGWNDFIIVVLCWWLSALKAIVLGRSDSEELRFMDGPPYISVTKLGNGCCRVDCFDEGADRSAEFSGQFQLTDLLDSVLGAAKTAHSVCSRNKWDNDDVDELARLIKELSTKNRGR